MENNKTIKVSLIPRNHLLQEVIVRPNNQVRFKNDTLVIDVDGIKVIPHGSTTDLLKKIPEAKVGAWGNVEILGKTVSIVTINGRQIFGGNTKATLETIKADMIESLEIIQSKSGQKGVELNLKLKKGRDNGWFGETSLGISNDETRSEGLKLNRLTPKYFYNFFLNENTINEKVLSANSSQHISSMISSNGMDGAFSITSNQINFLFNSGNVKGIIEMPELNKRVGVNNSINIGANFTYNTKISDWNGFILGDFDKQSLNEINKQTNILSESVKQITNTISQKPQSYGQLWSAIYGAIKPNKLTSFKTLTLFQTQLNRQVINSQSHFSLIKNENNNVLENDLNTNIDQRLSLINFLHKFQWTRRCKKAGFITSLYGLYSYNQIDTKKQYQNQLFLGRNQVNGNHNLLNKENPEEYFNLQFVQSVPLLKKLLFEFKNTISYNNNSASQYVQKFDNQKLIFQDTIKSLTLSRFQVRDVQNQLQTILFLKTKRSDLIVGLNWWYWNTIRPNANYELSNLSILPTLYWRWNYTNQRHLFIYLNQSQKLPNFNQLYPLADSSSLQQHSQGNPYLTNYPKFQLGGAAVTSYGIITIQPNFEYEKYENTLSLGSKINQNNTISQTFIQKGVGHKISGGLRAYNLSRKNISWTLNTSFSIDNQTTIWESNTILTGSYFGLVSGGIKWNPNEDLNIAIDIRSSIFGLSQQKKSNFKGDLILAAEYTVSPKTYLNASLDMSIIRNSNKELLNYPIADISLSQFVLKNNGLKLTLQANNIFNINQIFNSFALANTQIEYFNNRLPRFFMLTGTFYIEKWVK